MMFVDLRRKRFRDREPYSQECVPYWYPWSLIPFGLELLGASFVYIGMDRIALFSLMQVLGNSFTIATISSSLTFDMLWEMGI